MTALALELGVIGLMNAQFAVKDQTIYVLEVNPRGSRTVPFVSKAIGVPLAKLAMKVMVGKTLQQLNFTDGTHTDAPLGQRSSLPLHEIRRGGCPAGS